MADGQLLSLKWNNHNANFRVTIASLQEKELYSDATIACDGHFFPVHKLILSTCSDYFAGIFERTPCKHPVIVLKDVAFKEVNFLLSYMYGGEVSVAQNDLPGLIKAAETLRIKGLAAPDELSDHSSDKGEEKSRKLQRKEDDRISSNAKRQKISNTSNDIDLNQEEDEVVHIKEEKDRDPESIRNEELNNTYQDSNPSEQEYSSDIFDKVQFNDFVVKQETDVDDMKNRNKMSNDDISNISWPTSIMSPNSQQNSLGLNNVLSSYNDTSPTHLQLPTLPLNIGNFDAFKSSYISNLSNLKLAPIPATHPCDLCPKMFQSRADAARHMRVHTGEKPFECPYCDYRAALKGNLKSHILGRHSELASKKLVRNDIGPEN